MFIVDFFKGFFRRNVSGVTYADLKKLHKRKSKSQLIKMIVANQIIIEGMAKEFGVKNVATYLRKKK